MDTYGVKNSCAMPMGRDDLPVGTDAAPEDPKSPKPLTTFYLVKDGAIEEIDHLPELRSGEGFFGFSEGMYVKPLEILTDYLKSGDAAEWLEFVMVRQLMRVHLMDPQLVVYAERG